MDAERVFLPVGTTVEFDNGDVYRIVGDPIGCGGGSILYPVRKQFLQNGVLQMDGILYALKECYPVSLGHAYTRKQTGEIVPVGENTEDMHYLQRSQMLQLEEKNVTQKIYRTADKILPVRDASASVFLTLPGGMSVPVSNTVTVMDSLSGKGRALTGWIRERRRFTPAETFRIIQQVLFALQEVHQAGYLHLDIQDGNVFLRGTLEDKNELVTLIDFGCARELRGPKTAPIDDKVIFTTQGFSAPEILLHNDGTLQLGPEADIYSVGCLALYLLTGQRANVRDLMENRTGVFLRPNQLRRIKCPKHLVDTMQRILAKALAKEPENRYPSVEAMLPDVTALADALQPYRTDLRSVKYDAFVCYRHGAVDSMAALTLQRALENYRAPKGVGTGRKPFGRVFVDEGELSSCADFGQQIRDALKNSGWLIVICSPDTPASPWVQLEIDTFLEYHDRSRILAVLTGGSPETAFPPQLKGDLSGAGEVFAAHALSSTPADAQKQLKRAALLKIAAPMLGTTYDTLKQRHRIYRLQRMAAVTAGFLLAAVGFAGYALNRAAVIAEQAVRIEAEYEKALINESLFLAEQAEKKLAENDPLGAMELALQALPSEKQDRPVLTEAEFVLGKALGIYKTPSVTEDTATPVGRIDTACPYFFLNPEGTNLFAWDDYTSASGSRIECRRTEDGSLLWEISLDHGISAQPILSSGGGLYVMGYHNLHCFDAATGREKWSIDIPNTKAMSLSQNAAEVLVIAEEKQDDVPQLRLTAIVLDSSTGKELCRKPFRIDGHLRVEGTICISPDLQLAAIPTGEKNSEDFSMHSFNSLYLANLETGTCEKLLDSRTEICRMAFVDNTLAVLRSSGYSLITQHNVLYEYHGPHTCWLETFNIHDHSLVWQQKITDYFESGGICEILQTDYDDGTATGTGLLYLFHDHCVLLDQTTGSIIRQYKLPAAAATVSLTEKGFETINTDGSCTAAGFSIDTLMQIRYFSSVVSEVCQSNGMYFVQSETLTNHDYTICQYQLNRFDDSYRAHFTADSNAWRVYDGCIPKDSGKVLLLNQNRVCLVDLKTEETWIREIPEDYGFSEYRIVGTSSGGDCLYWAEDGHWEEPDCWINDNKYHSLNLITGELAVLQQPPQPHAHIQVCDVLFDGDSALMTATWYDGATSYVAVYVWNTADGTLTQLLQRTLSPAPDGAEGESVYLWENYLQGSLVCNGKTRQLSFAFCENRTEVLTGIVCLDLDTGDARDIPLRIAPEAGQSTYGSWQKYCYQWNASKTQAVFAYGSRIYVADSEGITVCSIPVAQPPVSLQYTPDENYILAVSESGVLSKYRIADSVCCASVNLAEHCSSLYTVYAENWTWLFPDENTLLAVSNFGGFLMDISGDSVKIKAIVDQCIGYEPGSSRIIVAETDSYSGKNTTIGSFRRYTTEDLIRKANAVLNK